MVICLKVFITILIQKILLYNKKQILQTNYLPLKITCNLTVNIILQLLNTFIFNYKFINLINLEHRINEIKYDLIKYNQNKQLNYH